MTKSARPASPLRVVMGTRLLPEGIQSADPRSPAITPRLGAATSIDASVSRRPVPEGIASATCIKGQYERVVPEGIRSAEPVMPAMASRLSSATGISATVSHTRGQYVAHVPPVAASPPISQSMSHLQALSAAGPRLFSAPGSQQEHELLNSEFTGSAELISC